MHSNTTAKRSAGLRATVYTGLGGPPPTGYDVWLGDAGTVVAGISFEAAHELVMKLRAAKDEEEQLAILAKARTEL